MSDFSINDIKRMSSGGTLAGNTPVRKIVIGIPRIEIKKGKAYQYCKVSLGDVEKEIFFSVDEQYADYLCCERGDAYLIGLLNLAMRECCNIHSEVPLTSELVHQLQTELMPALTKYSGKLYAPSITGKLDSTPLPSAHKTATGCSCGIDSLHAIKKLSETLGGMYKPDFLVINNVGAYTSMDGTSRKRYEDNVSNARSFAAQYGAPLFVTDSNFADVFPQDHLRTHLYSSVFAIYMLRKLWCRYYYASTGYDLVTNFQLDNHEEHDAARYDLIALPAFSIPQLRICNEGNYANRFEKTKELATYEPAWSFLNVCLTQGKGNCGYCPKCKRTLWALDALGELDKFSKVFDTANYSSLRSYYLRELYIVHRYRMDDMLNQTYEILSRDMSFTLKLHAILDYKLSQSRCWHTFKRIMRIFMRK